MDKKVNRNLKILLSWIYEGHGKVTLKQLETLLFLQMVGPNGATAKDLSDNLNIAISSVMHNMNGWIETEGTLKLDKPFVRKFLNNNGDKSYGLTKFGHDFLSEVSDILSRGVINVQPEETVSEDKSRLDRLEAKLEKLLETM